MPNKKKHPVVVYKGAGTVGGLPEVYAVITVPNPVPGGPPVKQKMLVTPSNMMKSNKQSNTAVNDGQAKWS